MDNTKIDVDRLARRGESLSGAWPLAAFERLGTLLADAPDGAVRWRASARQEHRVEGGTDSFLMLAIAATLPVPCVRCLEPVAVVVDDEREFLLVADEETAARRDDPDSELEVVVAGAPFDLAGLVEDELILAVPVLPRHADCHMPDDAGDEDPHDAVRRPFEGLGHLIGKDGDADS